MAFWLSSTAFCFPQRLSAFFNGFPVFLDGFPLSEKSKKIYLRQQVYKRSLFEHRISRHLLPKLRNFCYNVYISPTPTTGTKIWDYFFVQNEFSLIPGMQNKPKVPPQKVDSDGHLQFDENRVYDGPNRITGIMSISALCNVRQAIGNLPIELEGNMHQIRYKPTQRKNSKA